MVRQVVEVSESAFHLLNPILILARICGLFPVEVSKNNGKITIRCSKKFMLHSYLFGIIIGSLTLYGLYGDISLTFAYSTRMVDTKSTIITTFDISFIIIIGVSSIILSSTKTPYLLKLIKIYTKIDKILPSKNIKRYQRNSKISMVLIFSFYLILLNLDMFNWGRRSKNVWIFLKNYFAYFSLYQIVIVEIVFNCHMVFLVNINLKSLNDNLEGLYEYGKLVVQGNRLRFKEKFTPLDTERFVLEEDKSGTVTEEKIFLLMSTYIDIFKAVDILNGYFGLSLVVLVVSCIIHLIESPYFFLITWAHNSGTNYVLTLFMWVLAHCLILLIIVEPWNLCLLENKKTTHILNKLLTCDFKTEIKDELITFSTTLTHCKLKFSLSELTNIDRSLLTKIAGAVTTYLVILFQFIEDQDKCNKKS